MNKAGALQVLGADENVTSEELHDLIDEKIFEVKNKILKAPYLPRVVQIQIDRLQRLKEALTALDIDMTEAAEEIEFSFEGALSEQYKKYQEHLQRQLLSIARSTTVNALINSGTILKQLQQSWYHYVYNWQSKRLPENSNFTPTLSKVVEPVSIYKGIEVFHQQYDEVLTSGALHNEVLHPLLEEITRIKKYMDSYE